MQRTLILIGLVLLVMAGWSAHGQEVFSNGVDLSGSYLIGNGFIDMVAHTNSGPSDPEVRDYGPSIGQMYGVEPDTGNSISNPTNLLTLKPRQYDLGQSSNRVFVIAAEQLTAGSSISISYTNNLIYISVAAGSVGTASLNLTETDSRYVQDNGDTLSGDLDLGGNDLNGIDILQFDSGQLALSEGSGSHSRFSGQDAGILNTGDYWIGLGLEAGRSGTGDNVNAFGVLAGYSNEGSSVNAIGKQSARGNVGDNVNGSGFEAVRDNAGDNVNGLGYQAAMGNSANHVCGFGYHAAVNNSGEQVYAIGSRSCQANEGNYVNGIGPRAARYNSGTRVTAMSYMAGYDNTGDNCFFAGWQAGYGNTNDNVIAIGENMDYALPLKPRSCYLDGDLRLEDCNGKGGGAELHFANGAAITTTATQFNFGGAYLTNFMVMAAGDLSMGTYTNQP